MVLGPIKSRKQRQEEQAEVGRLAAQRLQQAKGDDFFLETPVEEISSRMVTPDDPVTSVPEYMSDPQAATDEAIAESGNLELQVQAMGPVFNPATNQFTDDPEIKRQALSEEQLMQTAQASRFKQDTVDEQGSFQPGTLDFRSREELISKPEVQEAFVMQEADAQAEAAQGVNRLELNEQNRTRSKDQLNDDLERLADRGIEYNQMLGGVTQPLIADDSPASQEILSTLQQLKLYDSETRVLSPKLGNGLAVAAALVGKDMMDREDDRIVKRKDFSENNLYETTEGMPLNATMMQNRMAEEVLNLVADNPTALSEQVRTGFGGAGTAASPRVKAGLNAVFAKVLNESGMFSQVPDPEGNPYPALSAWGQEYVNAMTPMLREMGLITDIDVSSSPTVGGTTAPFQAREKGKRKAGNISATNKYDPNTAKADLAKSILGSIPNRVIEERFMMARMMVNSVVGFGEVNPYTNQPRLILRDRPDRRHFYSNGMFAETLGLDETKWRKAYDHAIKTMPEEEAIAQANMVMRKEAKKIIKILDQGAQKGFDRVFYNKIFHATSVGRFFMRNTVLNPQDSKSLARMFLGNAKKVVINPSQDRNTETFENFMYITGRNLLTLEQTNGVDIEDMGWNAIMDASRQMFNDKKAYDNLVLIGNKLKAAVDAMKKDPQANLEGFLAADPALNDIFKKFTDKGEWAYSFQSYIDIANYDQAMKSGGTFETKAQTQHDGKQNGIAIQATQAGDVNLLKRVGMIFSNKTDEQGNDITNVLPLGDIRKLFANNLYTGIETAFAGKDDKKSFWYSVVENINNADDSRGLIKDLSKQPLMEVSYGRAINMNDETASDFIYSPKVKASGIIDVSTYQGGRYSPDEMIADLNDLITATLTPTLNFTHQKIYKQAGHLWSMFGVVPSMQGPMGNTIYMGSTEYFKTGETLKLAVGDEIVGVELTKPEYTGSARTKKRKLVRDKETGWVLQERSRYGQEVANQLPVLTVQQIDAAVMAESVIEVNRKMFDSGQGVQYLIPVHDAIITDASSVKQYHAAINKNFTKINKQYSIAKAIYNGLMGGYETAMRSINPSQMYDMNDESKYRSLHEELQRLHKEANEGVMKVVSQDRQTTMEAISTTPEFTEQILRTVTKGEGAQWNPDGTGQISGAVLKKALTMMLNRRLQFTKGGTSQPIRIALTNWHKRAERERQSAFKEFNLNSAQYN